MGDVRCEKSEVRRQMKTIWGSIVRVRPTRLQHAQPDIVIRSLPKDRQCQER